jgi:ABC-type dipeptide/oligopeptide/nickel transport system permease component
MGAVISAVGLSLLLGIPLAIWMYAVAHSLFNHAQRGLAFLMIFLPAVSLLYVAFHRCSKVAAAA